MTKRDLPPRCYLKHGAFFYVTPANKWVNLGRDRDKALQAYAAMAAKPAAVSTMPGLVDAATASLLHGRAVNTQKQYKVALARIRSIFAEFRVEDVRPKHIAAVKVEMRETPNMANRVLTLLRLLFAYAIEQQLVEWNPTLGVKPHTQHKRTRLISHDEIEKIIAVAPPRLAALIYVLRLSGQRVSDVLALRRSDVTDEGLVFVQAKTGAKLLIRWNPDLRAAIDRALALHVNIKALTVFHDKHGGPPSYHTTWEQWRTAVAKAGVPDARIHDLRAVAVTAAHRQGLDPQSLAGHTNRKMTERYIRDKMGVEAEAPLLSKKVSNLVRKT